MSPHQIHTTNSPPHNDILRLLIHRILPLLLIIMFLITGTTILIYSVVNKDVVPAKFVVGSYVIIGVFVVLWCFSRFLYVERMGRRVGSAGRDFEMRRRDGAGDGVDGPRSERRDRDRDRDRDRERDVEASGSARNSPTKGARRSKRGGQREGFVREAESDGLDLNAGMRNSEVRLDARADVSQRPATSSPGRGVHRSQGRELVVVPADEPAGLIPIAAPNISGLRSDARAEISQGTGRNASQTPTPIPTPRVANNQGGEAMENENINVQHPSDPRIPEVRSETHADIPPKTRTHSSRTLQVQREEVMDNINIQRPSELPRNNSQNWAKIMPEAYSGRPSSRHPPSAQQPRKESNSRSVEYLQYPPSAQQPHPHAHPQRDPRSTLPSQHHPQAQTPLDIRHESRHRGPSSRRHGYHAMVVTSEDRLLPTNSPSTQPHETISTPAAAELALALALAPPLQTHREKSTSSRGNARTNTKMSKAPLSPKQRDRNRHSNTNPCRPM